MYVSKTTTHHTKERKINMRFTKLQLFILYIYKVKDELKDFPMMLAVSALFVVPMVFAFVALA
jgi:hypothetical protein